MGPLRGDGNFYNIHDTNHNHRREDGSPSWGRKRGSQVPNNELIKHFGSYELSFGTIWIISYHLFRSRDFITLLLPEEYEERSERT